MDKIRNINAWLITSIFLLGMVSTAAGGTIYVDTVYGDDDNGGLRPEAAFATIQKGIDAAVNGEVVLVYPGLYQEEINFLGKALTVQGVAAGPAGVPVLQNPGDFAVSFYYGEGPDSVLKNFIIRDSFMGVFIASSSPTISNLTIVDNKYGIEAYTGSEPDISNCIFWNNSDDDLFGCEARYSCIERGGEGEGNIDVDPLFFDPDTCDYHLRSERGRYWPEHDVWVLDKVTSPCVDGGDPNAEALNEPMPNGGQINIGAYGGTPEASLSLQELSCLPCQASNPSPANGAVSVETDVILSWTAGLNAVSHDVYFGTDDSLSFVSNQTTTQFDPGMLDAGTTYFWCIDEINSAGRTTGTLWTFTTEPIAYAIENVTATASSALPIMGPENTVNGSGLDADDLHSTEQTDMWISGPEPEGAWIEFEFDKVYKLHEMLVWNSNQKIEYIVGFGCKDVTIEYSADGTNYVTLGTTHEFAQAPGTPGYAHNTTIDFGGVVAKNVRLTISNNWGFLPQYSLSEVRFTYIPPQPPVPPPPGPPPPPSPPPKNRCFLADTPVWVNGALVQISNVASGQMIGEPHCGVATDCLEQIETVEEHEGTFECRDIVLESGNRISVVDAHCFMLDSGQWIAAQDLRSGLRLKTLSGTVGIKSVATRAVPFVGKVYNLKIIGADRYLVSEDGVIVRDY